jgi:hypothetical protein
VNKITLITPPDYFENSNPSILLIGLNEEQQDQITVCLGNTDVSPDLNVYYYQDEDNLEWLLYALARSGAVFVNGDCENFTVRNLLSYILSRPTVYWTTKDEDLKKLFGYINGHYVNTIEDFFKGLLDE